MQRNSGRIFAAGIVWDHREPLPPEFHGSFPHVELGLAPAVYAVSPHVDKVPVTPPQVQPGLCKALPEYTIREHGRNVLPPLSISISIDASVVQDTAKVTVTQTFWNDSSRTIKEAAYTFPLPTGCTVTDFSCRIGTNKFIKGNAKPKEDAREAFQHHIRNHGTGAALLEQDTPEVFTATLGNIPEKTKVKVNLSFITVLKHRFADRLGQTTLTIPTYIASRYGSPPEGYKNAASTDVPQGLTLNVEVIESEKVKSIVSNSHRVVVDHRQGKGIADTFADLAGEGHGNSVETALVRLHADSAFLDRDFVLDIVTEHDGDIETPQAWLDAHLAIPDHKALMLTLPPKFLNRAATVPLHQKSEILFLADLSGSMSDKMLSLKSAMQFFLKGIPEGKKFNIWNFGSQFTSWCPQSVDSSTQLAYVDKTFKADMGGTELFPAVQAIVTARDKALMTDIIVLTDGQTWRLEQTLDFIQKTRAQTEGRVRFFSLGIGNGVSHALVEGIAKAGGGYAEVVPSSIHSGWEDRVVTMLKAAITTDHLGPLDLQFTGRDKDGSTTNAVDLPSAQRSPADISTLTPFVPNRIYFLLANSSPTTITITTPSNPVGLTIPITCIPKKDTTLHELAARSLLNDLERGQSYIHLGPDRPLRGSWAETSVVRREAESIACKWGLLSKWTSFFLVEEPYVPRGDDAFMDHDWVVEVKETTGDDLLQKRGDASAVVDAWATIQGPMEAGNDATDPLDRFAVAGRVTNGRRARPRKQATSLQVGPDDSSCSLGPRSVTLGGSAQWHPYLKPLDRERCDVYHDDSAHTDAPSTKITWTPRSMQALPGPQGLSRNKGRKPHDDTDWVRVFLQHQHFDGSFGFPRRATAEACLGKAVVDTLLDYYSSSHGHQISQLYTAAAIVILRRDFASCKALWSLMESKAMDFLEKTLPGAASDRQVLLDYLEVVARLLEGLRVPVYGGDAEDVAGSEDNMVVDGPREANCELVERAPYN